MTKLVLSTAKALDPFVEKKVMLLCNIGTIIQSNKLYLKRTRVTAFATDETATDWFRLCMVTGCCGVSI